MVVPAELLQVLVSWQRWALGLEGLAFNQVALGVQRRVPGRGFEGQELGHGELDWPGLVAALGYGHGEQRQPAESKGTSTLLRRLQVHRRRPGLPDDRGVSLCPKNTQQTENVANNDSAGPEPPSLPVTGYHWPKWPSPDTKSGKITAISAPEVPDRTGSRLFNIYTRTIHVFNYFYISLIESNLSLLD